MKWTGKLQNILLTLWGVLTVLFYLFQVMPGDATQMMMGQHDNLEQKQILQAKYGFDLPVIQQYAYWINDISPLSFHQTTDSRKLHFWTDQKYSGWFTGGSVGVALKLPYFRTSYLQKGKAVHRIIAPKIINTFVLAVAAISIASVIGILLGLFLHFNPNKTLNYWIEILSIVGMSTPSFFASILIAWFFGYYLSDLFSLPMTGSLFVWDDLGESKQVAWKHLILPAVTLGIRPLAVISQLTKGAMEDVWSQDFILTAFSKGLSTQKVAFLHALPNALNPVVTAISGWFASLLAGAVFVEYIFAWDGIGKLLVESLEQLDIPIVFGIVVFIASVFIVINLLVDALYGILNPKVRLN